MANHKVLKRVQKGKHSILAAGYIAILLSEWESVPQKLARWALLHSAHCINLVVNYHQITKHSKQSTRAKLESSYTKNLLIRLGSGRVATGKNAFL